MLIVVEGLDGAGKSTQVKRLKEYLQTMPQPLEYIHFPRYESPVYGKLISEFLRGEFGDNGSVHPILVALLYAEDRHNAAGELKEMLQKGGNVLLDRYVYSNIAYQCAKVTDTEEREKIRKWIIDTEYGDFGLPVPDLNIFLDVPLSFISEKLSSTRKGSDRSYLDGQKDIHEADLDFQKKVREVYLSQCAQDERFIRIDCSDSNGRMLPAEEIFLKIKSKVDILFEIQK